jgi:predicted phage terminase large subunit-like protein
LSLIRDPLSPDRPRPFAFTPSGPVHYDKDLPGDSEWEEQEQMRMIAAVTTLSGFIRYVWPILNPGRELLWDKHLDVVCYALEQLLFGNIEGNELVINIPPRSLKSVSVSQCMPAWAWLYAPWIQTLGVASGEKIAVRDTKAMRRLVSHPKYVRLAAFANEYLGTFGYGTNWEITADQNQKMRFETTAGGHRVGLAAGAAITGEGADIFIVDDPIDAKKAIEGGREAIMSTMAETIERYGGVWHSRLNDPKRSVRVTIMQRLHEADLSGWLLDQGVANIVLPTEYNPDHPHKCDLDWRTERGELLIPSRIGPAEVATLKRTWAAEHYAAQHDQLPTPMGGGMFPSDRWRHYTEHPRVVWHRMRKSGKVIASYDIANKVGERNAYSVIYVLAKANLTRTIYVLAEYRGQWEYPALERMIEQVDSDWSPSTHVIEDAANGTTLIQAKGRRFKITPVQPAAWGGKETRANYTQSHQSDGSIELPEREAWVPELIREHATFPRGNYADRVDALSQGCLFLDVIDNQLSHPTSGLDWLKTVGSRAYNF